MHNDKLMAQVSELATTSILAVTPDPLLYRWSMFNEHRLCNSDTAMANWCNKILTMDEQNRCFTHHKVKDIPGLETKHINSPVFWALDQMFTGYQPKQTWPALPTCQTTNQK